MSTKKRTKKSQREQKIIFVTGGVVSSIGKGLAAASLGALLEAVGHRVTIMKFDPYLNVDPGTMSPFQHGEVFVTDDGAETDLDLGHYERFTQATMKKTNSVSTGQVYETVIERERRGDYLGGTVQVIPHITDEIKLRMLAATDGVDVLLIEIGGTVGDIESQPFLEAIRQIRQELPRNSTALVHVTFLPYIKVAGELKSKPTQHSVKELREIGLQPDFLICRSEVQIDPSIKKKISLFCSVPEHHVVAAPDSEFIYDVPLVLHEEKLDDSLLTHLHLKKKKSQYLDGWKKISHGLRHPKNKVLIAVVGKYVDLKESYKSLHESLVHAGIANKTEVEIQYVDSEKLNSGSVSQVLKRAQGILVPGGFGTRGVEGKLLAIQHAREKKIPFFGICFGMQLAAIEFSRNVLKIKNATSREFIKEAGGKNSKSSASSITHTFVIDSMIEQRNLSHKGGTMRLGSYSCHLQKGSRAQKIYQSSTVHERHRHRYEFNNQFVEIFREKGLMPSGVCRERDLVEILELQNHPWFIGVQFHPEFKSKPLKPHPLFSSFVKAAIENS
ncbi:MAG: CTP synthase [Pseudobdellovibrionaceae bacterium]